MERIIAIGDVHGCHLELEALLNQLSPTSEDRIIQIGDLVNRGPESGRVVRLAREAGFRSLLGNHERRLLRYRWSKDATILKKIDYPTLAQLTDQDWHYLEAMPLFHHEEFMQTVFVHAGFLPGSSVPWVRQPAEILAHIQVIDAHGKPAKRADVPDGTPWADRWTGPPFVVYGHTPRTHVYRTRWSLGIDTACVYGGHLTASIFPGAEIVQVKARQTYAINNGFP